MITNSQFVCPKYNNNNNMWTYIAHVSTNYKVVLKAHYYRCS